MLLDEKGSEVETSVGPYNVGGTLILTCDILGGEIINKIYLKYLIHLEMKMLKVSGICRQLTHEIYTSKSNPPYPYFTILKYKNFALKSQIYVTSCQVKQNLPG